MLFAVGTGGFVLSRVDLLIIAGATALVVGVGLWASRRTEKTTSGYFLASGRMPWWIIGSAFVSTSVSSEQIVGTVGFAYREGMGIANWEWWSLPVYAPLILFFIPLYLRNRITTVPEFLSRRFGSVCGNVYSNVMLVAYVFIFLVPVLYGGSLTFSRLTGWPFRYVLWATVVLVGLYTIKGGLVSVMWTDAVQCAMLLGGGLVLFWLALHQVPGGWSAMVKANPERFHLYNPPEATGAPFLGLILGSIGVFLFYQATNQVMIQRVLGARSTWDGIMGIIFAGLINMFRPLVTCFLGLIVYHWIFVMHKAPPLAKPDDTFAFAMATFAPKWGLRGIILAGFLAAIMSTISALANSTATIFSLDVYRKLINPTASDARLVSVGRLASMVALVTAGLAAPWVERMGGIFPYFQRGVTYLAVPFMSVVLLGIFWWRTNEAGGIFGVIGGLILAGLAMAASIHGALGGDQVHPFFRLHWLYLGFMAQVITMIGVVVVSLATSPPPASQWEPFRWRPSLLENLDEGRRRPWWQSLKLWFVVFAVAWIGVYWWFW
jgi:solute:Na+ symporter, SSS family